MIEPSPFLRDSVRSILFTVGVVFIFAGPIWVQLMGGYLTPWTRSWRMYSLTGLGTCEATFTRHHADGRQERLDRFEVLGIQEPKKYKRYRLRNGDQIKHHGRDLCRALDGGATDIRVHARCPTQQGWHTTFEGKRSVCL